MSRSGVHGESVYEKYAWSLVSVVGVLGIVAGIGDFIGGAGPFVSVEYNSITGLSWKALVTDQPTLANFIDILTRVTGLFLISNSALALGVSFKGYRMGEKWSWYVLWILPAVLLLAEGLEIAVGGSILLEALYGLAFLLSLMGLLLPLRRFFPRP